MIYTHISAIKYSKYSYCWQWQYNWKERE